MACSDIYIPKRQIIVALLSLGMMIIHAMRVNVGVTVVTLLDKGVHTKVGTLKAMESLPEADWDSRKIGFLHSIFYVGYLLTQLPAGYLSTVLPSHRLFGGCILVSCSLNLLLPVAIVSLGYGATCVVRAIQGLSEGVLYPSCYALLRHWTMAEERSSSGAVVLTGVYLGPVLGLIVSGYVTHQYDWTYVYYGHGGVGIIWFIFWLFLAHEKPAHHPYISENELKMISKSQGESAIIYEHDTVPWRAIFTSVPVLALSVCNFVRSFVFFMLLTNEPTYLNEFGYTIAENGFLSSLPHAVMAVMAVLSGPLADLMMRDTHLTATQVRKLFTCAGFGIEALCMYFLGFINMGTPALVFLTVGVGGSGLTISGWQINHLDLAPRYASVLVAITTAVGTLAGILNPIIVGEMTRHQTLADWHNVFLLTGSVVLVAVIFYGIFGSGVKQPWAEPLPQVTILGKSNSPLEHKPYGTFHQQLPDEKLSEGSPSSAGSAAVSNGSSRSHSLHSYDSDDETVFDASRDDGNDIRARSRSKEPSKGTSDEILD